VTTYTVTQDPRLEQMLRDGSERAQAIMRAGLSDIGHQFVERAVELAGGDGHYAQSFSSTPNGDSVTAGSRSPMAGVIERGRKPGRRPPPASIRKRSGGSYAAASKAADRIEHHGTKGRYVVKKAAASIRNSGTIAQVVRNVAVAIVHGG